MGNLSISSACNHDCSYCFARPSRTGASDAGAFMTMPVFENALSLLAGGGVKKLALIGGEPTLHPRFREMLETALSRFDSVMLFTNGDMPADIRGYLSALPLDRVTVLVNLTDCTVPGAAVEKTLRECGARCMPGVTVYRTGQELDFLLAAVEKFGMRKRIRVGIAQPDGAGGNRVPPPRSYEAIGRQVIDFALRAGDAGVKLNLDCGFVPCMFGPAGESLFGGEKTPIGMNCGPIPDILQNGDIIHCYPCAFAGRLNIDTAGSLSSAKAALSKMLLPLHGTGIFPECGECRMLRGGHCTGGCRGAVYRRLRKANVTFKTERRTSGGMHSE